MVSFTVALTYKYKLHIIISMYFFSVPTLLIQVVFLTPGRPLQESHFDFGLTPAESF